MAESVYFYRHSTPSQKKNVDGSQKKLSFAPSSYQPSVIGDGLGDTAHKINKSEPYAHLDRHGNSLVEASSQLSFTSSTEIEELRHEVEKYRYVLDALIERLNTLAISSTTNANSVTESLPPAVTPTAARLSVQATHHYSDVKSSKGLAESVYVGFTNTERLAPATTQHNYELPPEEYRMTSIKTVVGNQPSAGLENFDSVSTIGENSLNTAVGGTFAIAAEAPVEMAKVKTKKLMNAGNSVYHARELLNDYYA